MLASYIATTVVAMFAASGLVHLAGLPWTFHPLVCFTSAVGVYLVLPGDDDDAADGEA